MDSVLKTKNKKRAQWLDRSLVVFPYYFTLCTTEKLFHRELKTIELPRKSWPSFLKTPQADATVHYFDSDEKLCSIVCIKHSKKHSIEQIAALLCHESVHMWQAAREYIGEKEPSAEFEAYSIQSIFQRLFEEYARQTK